jgi:hypothetical protein
MPGTIFISKTNDWTSGTPEFYEIADRIREAFPLDEKPLADHVFAPDFPEHVKVFKFFSVDDLDGRDFNCFVQATKAAQLKYINENRGDKVYEYYLVIWTNLISQLEMDPRYSPSGSNEGMSADRGVDG